MGAVRAGSPIGRLIRNVLVALGALLVITPASAAGANRLVAVGDLHGDLQAWQAIARAAGLIDAQGHWAGGKTTLVQLGDIVDRQPDSLLIIRSLQQLQAEAPRAGGRVVVILGNHEAMNLLGDFRYTTPGEFAAFADERSPARREQYYLRHRNQIEREAKAANPQAQPSQVRDAWIAKHPLGWVEHQAAWSPSGELGRWAARNPAIAKIDGTLFVHGGLSDEYARLPLEEINRRVAAAMAAGDTGKPTILEDPLGPLWYRGLILRDPDAEATRAKLTPPAEPLTRELELSAVLAAYGAQRLVVGHTPAKKGIEFLYGGRLARADTAISRAYGGVLSWLEIVEGRMIARTVPRP